MFVCPEFVFIEVPKTGSTYIDRLLIQTTDGRKIGKHNYPDPLLLHSGRDFIASIRDPFDWYISLHAYGAKVSDRSGPYRKVRNIRPFTFKGYGFDKNFRFALGAYANYLQRALRTDRPAFMATYAGAHDPALFRRWLTMLYHQDFSYLYNAIFAHSPLSQYAGFYTFRFLWLTCRNREQLLSPSCPGDHDALAMWEHENSYVDRFIRLERMSNDLLSLFDHYGYALTDEQSERIHNNHRHNASERKRDIVAYFDDAAATCIAARDRLLFEKFGYSKSVTEATAVEADDHFPSRSSRASA